MRLMLSRWIAGIALASLLVAAAEPSPVEDPLESARRAEVNGDPQRALELYRRAIHRNDIPETALAQAEGRLEWIEARSEDGFLPLARLFTEETASRHEYPLERLRAFAREVNGFPAGHVRRDARLFIAKTLTLREEWAEAIQTYHALQAEPGIDSDERREAAEGIAVAETKLGNLSAAIDSLDSAGLGTEPQAFHLRAQRLTNIGAPIAFGLIGLFGLVAFVSMVIVFGKRRLTEVLSWRRLLVGVVVVAVPVVLAARATEPARTASGTLAVALAGTLLFASFAGVASRAVRRGALIAAASAMLTCAAAGFVAATRGGFLESLLLREGVIPVLYLLSVCAGAVIAGAAVLRPRGT